MGPWPRPPSSDISPCTYAWPVPNLLISGKNSFTRPMLNFFVGLLLAILIVTSINTNVAAVVGGGGGVDVAVYKTIIIHCSNISVSHRRYQSIGMKFSIVCIAYMY